MLRPLMAPEVIVSTAVGFPVLGHVVNEIRPVVGLENVADIIVATGITGLGIAMVAIVGPSTRSRGLVMA